MLDASSPGDGERKAKAAAMSNPLFIRSIHCWVENVKWRRYLGCPASLRQPRYCPSVTEGMKHALQDPPLVSQDVEPCRGNSRCPTVLENTRSVSRRHQSWGVCICARAHVGVQHACSLGSTGGDRTSCCFPPTSYCALAWLGFAFVWV